MTQFHAGDTKAAYAMALMMRDFDMFVDGCFVHEAKFCDDGTLRGCNSDGTLFTFHKHLLVEVYGGMNPMSEEAEFADIHGRKWTVSFTKNCSIEVFRILQENLYEFD